MPGCQAPGRSLARAPKAAAAAEPRRLEAAAISRVIGHLLPKGDSSVEPARGDHQPGDPDPGRPPDKRDHIVPRAAMQPAKKSHLPGS